MKNTTCFALAAAFCIVPAMLTAQEPSQEEPEVTVILGDPNYADDVSIVFKENAPKRKRDAGLPRFAIIGNEQKFYLGIGAQFLGEAVMDFGDEMPSPYSFTPSSITAATAGNGANLRFTALTSSIYLNAVALPGTKNKVGLFFKAKIKNGNDYGFDVSHFYVTYRGFTAGYTSSLFADGAAMPYTIDDEGPNGSADLTVFTAGYTHKFNSALSAAIGIDAPTADITTDKNVGNINQRVPAVPAYIQYSPNEGSYIRLSGLVRPLQYRDVVAGKNRTPVGWGVQLSGLAQVLPALTFYYDATYGHGIADYLQDNTDLGLDAVPDIYNPGRSRLMKSLGLTAGMTVNLSSKVAMNAVYSHLTNMAGNLAGSLGDQYRMGDYVAANVIYTINKIVAVGMEYDYGHRKSFDGSSLHTNRLQAQLAVTF